MKFCDSGVESVDAQKTRKFSFHFELIKIYSIIECIQCMAFSCRFVDKFNPSNILHTNV